MAENINKSNFNTSAAAVTAVTTQSHSPSGPNQSNPATKPVPAWTRIVRGEPDPTMVFTLSSSSSPSAEEGAEDDNVGPNGNAGKRPAWNKPSNVVTESGPVIEAGMWPPLAESARAPKSSSDSSDGSSSVVPFSQGSRTATSSSFSQKQFMNNGSFNSNTTANYMRPARLRPMKQNSNVSSNGGLSQPPPQGPVVEAPLHSPSRDYIQRTGFVPHSGGRNDQPHPRNSFRHRNSGLHPRGNSSHQPNYGERRNQDHGNQDLIGRKFSGRDSHMQPRVVPSPMFMRPAPPPSPPNTGPFFASPHVRPFGIPTGFPDFYFVPVPHPESLRGVPFIQPMPPMFRPFSESHVYQLHARIMNQIDYYFSNENLIKDTYLRQNMDDQGWVPIKLIAGFRKVSLLTDNIQVILDAVRSSEIVEVQGDKIRKRDDWMRWVLPHPIEFPTKSGQDMLVAGVHSLSLDKGTAYNRRGAMSQGGASADGQDGSVLDGPASDSN